MSDTFNRYETPWAGWYFWNDYLVDPDGNRYSPDMVRSSVFAHQLQHDLLGSRLQIYSLKQELQRRIESYKPPQVVVYWGDGVQSMFERTY